MFEDLDCIGYVVIARIVGIKNSTRWYVMCNNKVTFGVYLRTYVYTYYGEKIVLISWHARRRNDERAHTCLRAHTYRANRFRRTYAWKEPGTSAGQKSKTLTAVSNKIIIMFIKENVVRETVWEFPDFEFTHAAHYTGNGIWYMHVI